MIDLERTPAMQFSRRMVSIKFIQHIQDDLNGMKDASKLPVKIAYLNQAYILHLVAYWQVFVEDLARYGFSILEKKTPDGPFVAIAKARLDHRLKKFNTPSKANIDELFSETLGIDRITKSWSEKIQPNNLGADTLKRVLDARHEIAHTGSADTALAYASNYTEMETLVELARVAEDRLRAALS